jgi:hypothetical protein
MSTRTHLVSISSIDPIRNAVASGDEGLVEAVLTRYADQARERYGEEIDEDSLGEFREYVESMILCAKPPKAEPGAWNYVIEHLAGHFQLAPDRELPFNDEDWKHYYVWEEYRGMVAGHLSAKSKQSLEYLENGRPLRGSKIDHDGCMFGWLAPDEVKELHGALAGIDRAAITDEEMEDFHDWLVESLKMVGDRNAVLFVAAH